MKPVKTVLNWLETHGAVPAYGGWVLMGLTFCFWLAATNTMAGWLFGLSGLGVALLLLSAAMPMRVLKGIEIRRSPLRPVHVGDPLWVELHLCNGTTQPKGLFIVRDGVPKALGEQAETVVEAIASFSKAKTHPASVPQASHVWQYDLTPERRGLYHWQTVTLRTGAPLGLFWSSRVQSVPATVLIYPRVLPLTRCPILEEIGPSAQQLFQQVPLTRTGNEGSTRSLRPYRTGDPMRMVHWRSSARFNALRVREMEVMSGGYTFIIALDTQSHWHPDTFEQAVMAAASLLHYATQKQYAPQLWTAQEGLIQNPQQSLEILAQIEPQATEGEPLLEQAAIWLTANPDRLSTMPMGSRYILWPQFTTGTFSNPRIPTTQHLGLSINPEVPLQIQLQNLLC